MHYREIYCEGLQNLWRTEGGGEGGETTEKGGTDKGSQKRDREGRAEKGGQRREGREGTQEEDGMDREGGWDRERAEEEGKREARKEGEEQK